MIHSSSPSPSSSYRRGGGYIGIRVEGGIVVVVVVVV